MGNGCGLGSPAKGRVRVGSMLGRSIAALALVAASLSLFLLASRHSSQSSSLAQKADAASSSPLPFIPAALRATPALATRSSKVDAQSILGQLPMVFEPNQGQATGNVKFLARGAGYGIFLDGSGAVLSLKSSTQESSGEHALRMKLAGANLSAAASGIEPLPGHSNYLIGNDPQKWHSGIPQYAAVRYASVYPGIDLVFYGNQGHLEYDFHVAPHANAAQAELQFEGASRLQLSEGDLVLTEPEQGSLRLRAPQIYQRDGERKQPVAGRFVLRAGNRVGFEIGAYDHNRELVIDPILEFSTYFGGSGAVTSPAVAVDAGGNIYVFGSTTSATGFPVGTTIPTTIGSAGNVFVAKITPAGPVLDYLTFLGGSGTDTAVGIGVDTRNFAYIVGNTTSPDFPTTSTGYQSGATAAAFKGSPCSGITCSSVFVSLLNASGAAPLAYSTYLGGNGNDVATGMTIDLNGDAFVTGTTTSTNAPATGIAFPATLLPVPFQITPLASPQFFVTKVNTALPSTSGIAYSTYFGGGTPAGATAGGGGIAVDPSGNIYFSGTTNFYNSGLGPYGDSTQAGTDFPILNSYQPCLDTPPPLVLPNPNPCTAPTTTPFPTDAFVAKIDPNAQAGAQLQFSTYLGGTVNDSSTAITVDSGAANIYLTGTTNSPDFVLPTGTAAYQPCLNEGLTVTTLPCPTTNANTDAYVARMSNPTVSTTGTPNDVALTYFTYLGGSGNDTGTAIAVLDTLSTSLDDVVVTGATSSTNFPVTATCPVTPCVIQSTLNGAQNAFYAQVNTTTVTGGQTGGSYVTYFGGNNTDTGTGVAVDTSQNVYLVGQTTSTNLQLAAPFAGAGGSSLNGTQDAFVVKWGTATGLCASCVPPIVSPAEIVSAGNQVTITYTIANQGPDPATNVNVVGTISQPATFNSATAASGTCATPSGNSATCLIPSLQAGSTATVVFVVTPLQQGNYQAVATVSSSNNTSTSSSQTATFTAGGYTMTMNPSAQIVVAGLPATYTVTVSPTASVFGSLVSLSCSSLPTGATCHFSTTSLQLNGPQSSTLNITTTPEPVPTAAIRPHGGGLYAIWLMVPGVALWGIGGKRRKRWFIFIGMLLLFGLMFLQPACSHTTPQPTVSGTPAGTYPLTVTATSGSFTESVPFSLTVTP